jgi:hypothetical protein
MISKYFHHKLAVKLVLNFQKYTVLVGQRCTVAMLLVPAGYRALSCFLHDPPRANLSSESWLKTTDNQISIISTFHHAQLA